MKKEKLIKALIFGGGRWENPQCGTPNQHKALCKKAMQCGFNSIQDFLYAWPAYRDKKINVGKDGSINKVESHWFFNYLRKVTPEQLHRNRHKL